MRGKKNLKVIPLGGLREIGKNMMVIEWGDEVIIIDAGLMFPKQYMLGVNYVIPDISYLKDKKVLGLFLTHGHEDHIGAIPHVIQELDCPIYGRKLTLAFLREKLISREVDKKYMRLNEVVPRKMIKLGPFKVEFIHVSHSIVDSSGLAIHTPAGVIVHTGDFRIDTKPFDDQFIDLERFSQYGSEGVLLMTSDSTNSEKEGYTISESRIRKELENLFAHTNGMVIVVTFASSIHRIQELILAAHESGKKVALSGRSLLKYSEISRELGYLKFPENTVIGVEEISKYPREKVMCITTGSQGEPYSSLSLIAAKRHSHIQLREGDIVILSSRIIPGNESPVNSIINSIYEMGASVIDEDEYVIHSSGHAAAEELKIMYRLVKPRFFFPVHGESKHLSKHYKLITDMRDGEEGVFILHNGDCLEFKSGNAKHHKGYVDIRNIYVDGKGVGDVGSTVLKDRKRLADNGIVFANISMTSADGKNYDINVDIISRGFIFGEGEHGAIVDEGKKVILDMIEKFVSKNKVKEKTIKYEAHSLLRRFFVKSLEREPLIVVVINGL